MAALLRSRYLRFGRCQGMVARSNLLKLILVFCIALVMTWGVAFNSLLVGNGAVFDGLEGFVFASVIGAAIAASWKVVESRSLSLAKRLCISGMIGVAMTVFAILLPLAFCTLIGCKGFYWF